MKIHFHKYHNNSLSEIQKFYANPEMMRYIGEGKTFSEEECKRVLGTILNAYSNESNTGHWAIKNELNEYIGKALLLPWDNGIDYEIGYAVFPAFQSKGLGMELAQKVLELAKQDGHKQLIATVHRKNKKSIRILKRLGFKFVRVLKKYGRRKDLYRLKID